MAGTLRIDSETTRLLSDMLRMAGYTLDSAAQELIQALYGIGPCWGSSDEVAQQFAHQYLPAKENLLKGCDDLGKLLRELADRVDLSMSGYEHVETTNTYNANGGNTNIGTMPDIPSVPTVPDATPVNPSPSPRGRR